MPFPDKTAFSDFQQLEQFWGTCQQFWHFSQQTMTTILWPDNIKNYVCIIDLEMYCIDDQCEIAMHLAEEERSFPEGEAADNWNKL